jgi:hypothetical protein
MIAHMWVLQYAWNSYTSIDVDVEEKREQMVVVVLYHINQGFNYHVAMLQFTIFVVVIPFF